MRKVQYADFAKFLNDVSKVPEDEMIEVFVDWRYGVKRPEFAEEGFPFWCYEMHDKYAGLSHLHFMDLAMDPMAGLFESYCKQNGLGLAKGERNVYFPYETVYDVKFEGRTITTVHDAFNSRPTNSFICVDTTTERPAIDMILSIPFWSEPMIHNEDVEMYRKVYKI